MRLVKIQKFRLENNFWYNLELKGNFQEVQRAARQDP